MISATAVRTIGPHQIHKTAGFIVKPLKQECHTPKCLYKSSCLDVLKKPEVSLPFHEAPSEIP